MLETYARWAHMTDEQRAVCERLLAEAMMDFASEMRMVDIEYLIELVQQDQYFNLHDLINSSAELFFMPGTLAFGWNARVNLSWTSTPSVLIDLEFRHGDATIFFTLQLEAYDASLEIKTIVFEQDVGDLAAVPDYLARAMKDAILPLQNARTQIHASGLRLSSCGNIDVLKPPGQPRTST